MISINATVILTILNFILLIFVLGAVLWKPMLKFLDDRARKIEESLKLAEENKKRAEELKNEHIETSLAEYRTNPDGLNSYIIFKAAEAGDEFARSMFDTAGYFLGLAIVNALNLLNFKRVAIGGGLAKAGDLIFEPTRRALSDRGFQSLSAKSALFPPNVPMMRQCSVQSD